MHGACCHAQPFYTNKIHFDIGIIVNAKEKLIVYTLPKANSEERAVTVTCILFDDSGVLRLKSQYRNFKKLIIGRAFLLRF